MLLFFKGLKTGLLVEKQIFAEKYQVYDNGYISTATRVVNYPQL